MIASFFCLKGSDFIKTVTEHIETIDHVLSRCPLNDTIVNNMIRAHSKINNPTYDNIICSISGGADSDIILDICNQIDFDGKITYVWYDTGLEYQATKNHLEFLESKYGITIERYKAAKPIPITCKQYGQPFLSKKVSDCIERLQSHDFKFEDKPLEELLTEYPNCKSALRWWCNDYECTALNVNNNKYLKEFLMAYPPDSKYHQDVVLMLKRTFFIN